MYILRLNYPIEEIENTLLPVDCLLIAEIINAYGKGETYKEIKVRDAFQKVKKIMTKLEFDEALRVLKNFGLVVPANYGRYFVQVGDNVVENEVALDFLNWMLLDVFDIMTGDGMTDEELNEAFEEYQNEKRDLSE